MYIVFKVLNLFIVNFVLYEDGYNFFFIVIVVLRVNVIFLKFYLFNKCVSI